MVCNAAGSFASRLTRGLAFAAAAVLFAFVEIARFQSCDSFHCLRLLLLIYTIIETGTLFVKGKSSVRCLLINARCLFADGTRAIAQTALRWKQQTKVYCLTPHLFSQFLTAQALFAIKIRRTRTQTAIPRECLLGECVLCTQADNSNGVAAKSIAHAVIQSVAWESPK